MTSQTGGMGTEHASGHRGHHEDRAPCCLCRVGIPGQVAGCVMIQEPTPPMLMLSRYEAQLRAAVIGQEACNGLSAGCSTEHAVPYLLVDLSFNGQTSNTCRCLGAEIPVHIGGCPWSRNWLTNKVKFGASAHVSLFANMGELPAANWWHSLQAQLINPNAVWSSLVACGFVRRQWLAWPGK
jgi:hypothetical protein